MAGYGAGDVISVLEALELNVLDLEWVNEIWREKFTTCPDDLPDEYSEKFSLLNCADTLEVMKHTRTVVIEWLKSDPASRTEGSAALASWTALQEIPHRHLLALIYFYIKKSNADQQNLPLVELGIKAAEFYFILLSIPGSSVYKIFQISLFEACMEVFNVYKCCFKVIGSFEGRGKEHKKQSQVDDEWDTLQQRSVLKLLNALLLSFQNLIQRFSFKSHLEAMKISLNVLAELTRSERQAPLEVFINSVDTGTFAPLARNAYLTMINICTEMHGRVAETIRLVLHRIAPNLSLVGGPAIPEMLKWSSKEQSTVRRLALWFVTTCVLPLGDPAFSNLKILIQNLCRSMPDRADLRSKATDMLISIISYLPEKEYISTLKWIFRECFQETASHKVAALELLSKLIYLKQGSPERSDMADPGSPNMAESSRSHLDPSHVVPASSNSQNDSDNGQPELMENSVGNARVISFCKPIEYLPVEFRRVMLAIIIDRIRDSAAGVRSKALNALSDIVSSRTSLTVQGLVRSIFVDPYKNTTEIDLSTDEPDFVEKSTFVAAFDKEMSKSLIPGATRIVKKILAKCEDEKVNVRRAAISLLVNVFKLNPQWMNKANLGHFGRQCRDPAMQVRKEMVGWVTDLILYFPSHHQLTQLWVEEVLPQVDDREKRVQEQALLLLADTIVGNIKFLEKTKSEMDLLPWKLLTHIATLNMRSFFVLACRLWRDELDPKKFKITPEHIAAITSHVGSAQDAPAWVMLASLSEYYNIPKPQAIMDHFVNVVAKGEGNLGSANLVLITLNNCWQLLSKDSQQKLQKHLFESLKNQSILPPLVPLVVKIAAEMTVALFGDDQGGKKEVAKWAMETVQECERHLEPCMQNGQSDCGNCESCAFFLILLGSLADLHPDQISRNTFEFSYSFLMAARSSATNPGLSKLKAETVLVLGRMALRDKYIASRLVPGLSMFITNHTDPVLLTNIIVTVADIGERFPNLIEPLVPALSLCLRNRHREVREAALVQTIELLQEDYLKARGALIYHLLSLINDPSPRTVSMVKCYFNNMLLRYSRGVDQLLVAAVFHYNKYYGHPMYNKLEMTEAEEAGFNLSGPRMIHKRLTLYRFLLSNLQNPYRIRCFHHIVQVVLVGVKDHLIDVSAQSGEDVLLDAFATLICKEMKVDGGEGPKKKGEEDDEEVVDEAAAQKAEIKKDFLLGMQKKRLVEEVIPIFSALRKMLFKNRKLSSHLYRVVRELVREHKSEIGEMFRDDPPFGEEILHELNSAARNKEDEDFMYQTQVEPNPEAVTAQVREVIASHSRRLSKRKSDEHEQEKEPKKRKSNEGINHVDSQNDRYGTTAENEGCSPTALNEVPEIAPHMEHQRTDEATVNIQSSHRNLSESDSAASQKDVNKMKKRKNKEVRSRCAEKSQQDSKKNASTKRSTRLSNAGLEEAVEGSSKSLTRGSLSCSMAPPRNFRSSRRNPVTPSVPPRKPHLLSSTPLIANPKGFDDTDISPVVQNSRNEDTA